MFGGLREAVVTHVQLMFDPSLEVDAGAVAALWADDPEAAAIMAGPPEVRVEQSVTYLPTVVEFVVIPLTVNLASTVLIALAGRIYRQYRPDGGVRHELADDLEAGDGRTIETIPGDGTDDEPPA
jgi:hypothetical protein